jgi:hypothetical protein
MGNPFLFADRFSGAVVHLTTGRFDGLAPLLRNNLAKTGTTKLVLHEADALSNSGPQIQKMPAAVELTQAFRD